MNKRWVTAAAVVAMALALGSVAAGCSVPEAGAQGPEPGSSVVIASGSVSLVPGVEEVVGPFDVHNYSELALQVAACGGGQMFQTLPDGSAGELLGSSQVRTKYTSQPVMEVKLHLVTSNSVPVDNCAYVLTGQVAG